MQTVTAFVARDPEACWRAFVDVAQLTRWVPGLRRAEILTRERGLPAEIHFEHASHAYTLVYTYDKLKREVSWQPKLGADGGVTGFARFEAEGGGTRFTYGLEPGAARQPSELQPVADAFATWMSAT